MSARPWFYFFAGDWRADTSLRMTSLAAQGLWINLLCLMHDADPRGHLVFNGKPLGASQIAKLIGANGDEVAALLAELEGNGVFDRVDDGVIVSRKMVRDSLKSAIQSANANARWSAKPASDSTGNAVGNAKHDAKSMPHMGVGMGVEDSVGSKSEQSGAPGVRSPKQARAKPAADPVFDQAWQSCTDVMRRRSSRTKSEVAWRQAIKRAAPEAILAALKQYRAKDVDVQRTGGPGLHTWLNDARWEGWLNTPAVVVPAIEVTADMLEDRLLEFAETRVWRPHWGEKPRNAA